MLTFGNYRLLLGFDNPAVLDGSAIANGAQIAVQDEQVLGTPGRIQEYTASLSTEKPAITLALYDFDPGEELTFFVEATSGDLKPVLVLRDYAGKPVRVANLQGTASQTSLDYVFPEGGEAYTLSIVAFAANGQQTSGDFRLLAGVDAPQVRPGSGEPNSTTVLRLPIIVQTGIKLQQIVAIDQQNEIMTAVGTIKMGWQDPRLAFSPDECNCQVKEYTDTSFSDFLKETGGDWPAYTFFNQQGNRWSLSRLVEIMPNGSVNYNERFSTNFQLNFDFKPYPFDTEEFYIHVDMLYPEDRYVMVPMEGFSEIDPENGEDEFILTDFDTSVSSVISSRIFPTSRFTFHWSAPRYKMYYIFRIFIPILLIIVISFITFLLKDFTRRIEVASGNVLLFIAFSWSLAEEYPRMGYHDLPGCHHGDHFHRQFAGGGLQRVPEMAGKQGPAEKSRAHRPGGGLGLPDWLCDFIRGDDSIFYLMRRRVGLALAVVRGGKRWRGPSWSSQPAQFTPSTGTDLPCRRRKYR